MTVSMGSRVVRAAALPIAAAMLAGCGFLQAPPPDWVVNRQPLESCGEEAYGRGEGADVEARRCLLAAFEDGRGAELITTQTSVEGDPITRYIRVHENGTVEIFHDATQDQYGSGGWERLRCDRLVAVEGADDPDVIGFPEHDVFVEVDCESLPVP